MLKHIYRIEQPMHAVIIPLRVVCSCRLLTCLPAPACHLLLRGTRLGQQHLYALLMLHA